MSAIAHNWYFFTKRRQTFWSIYRAVRFRALAWDIVLYSWATYYDRHQEKLRTKVVLFGVLRFLSSMRSVVSGSPQIETIFHVMLQHRTIRYFSACCLQMKANQFFLVVIAVFFASNSQMINIDIPSYPQRFYSKEVVVL